MGSLRPAALAHPAEDGLAPIVKRLALAFALSVAVILPGGYFGLSFSNLINHLDTVVGVKAEAISTLAAANPDLWAYQLQRMEDLLQRYPMARTDERATVRNAAGEALLSVGEVPDAPRLARSSPVFDSGRVVGRVEIMHSYRPVLVGTLIAALLSLALGVLVYAALLVLPLRALRRINAALVRESEALGASASRYRALAETANDAIITADGAGMIVGWNPAAERIFGHSAAEAVGQPLTLLMPPRYHAGYLQGMRRMQAGGERRVIGKSVELHGLTKAGREFPFELALSEWETAEGKFFAGIIRDISERKRAQLALSRQKDLYHMLSQTNESIVRLTNRDELFATVCRVAVEHGHFRFAWIGLIGATDQRLLPVARYGEDAGYIDSVNVLGDGARDTRRGLAARTLRSGARVISNDVLNDAAMAPWHEAARRAGVRAAAKFPLREAGAVIGAISLYASEAGFFTEELVATLGEIANDCSFALDNYAREAALVEGEERYRQMFQANPHPMWVYDLETLRFLEVNDAATAHYGWSREEFLAMTIADIRPPEEIPRLLDNIAHLEDGKVDAAGVWAHRKKDGTLIEVEITSHLLDFGGRRAEIVLAHDVTERKRAEDALRAAAEQFRGLVEQSIAGTYIIQEGKFAYVNPRFAEIFGYASNDELIGSDPLALVAEKDRSTVADNIRRPFEGAALSLSYNFTGTRRDGASVEVGVHGASATYRGRPAIIGLLQDISEKQRAEEQIRHYVAQLENAFMRTVEVATTLSEMRDPYTVGHERRVAQIAEAIGAELGFDARRREGLRVCGFLHDVGKITIPSEILSKPGKLNAAEFMLIKGHAQASYDILKNVEFPWPVAEVALQHHERADGSGYPQGLKGEAILLEARIMAVADVVEAMSLHRPYRPALGIAAALAEIERGRGTLYDPVVADACLRLFREQGYQLPQ